MGAAASADGSPSPGPGGLGSPSLHEMIQRVGSTSYERIAARGVRSNLASVHRLGRI